MFRRLQPLNRFPSLLPRAFARGSATFYPNFHTKNNLNDTAAMPVPPPIAKQKPHIVKIGHVEGENRGENLINPPIEINDPFFWLRDDSRSDPEVLAHLRAENEYFAERTKDLKDLTEKIYAEHISHIKETDTSAPYRIGTFSYYTRTVKGLSYKIHCRVPFGEVAGGETEQVLLDENKLAEGHSHCSVSRVKASPDHTLIAYSVDFVGNELFTIKFVENAAAVSDELTNTSGAIMFGVDNRCIFYVTKDEAKRSDKVWRHIVGQPQSADVCVFHEPNELFSVGLGKSGDGKTLIVHVGSSETTEVHLLDLERPLDAPLQLETVLPRNPGHRYEVAVHGRDTLFVVEWNKEKCINGRVIKAKRAAPLDLTNEVVPHRDDVLFENMDVFKSHLALEGRFGGLTQVWTLPVEATNAAALTRLAVPDPVYAIEIVHSHNQEFEAGTFRVCYSSLTTPATYWDVDLATHAKSVVKVQEVGGGFDSANYVCERLEATASDGTKIPISILRRKDLDMSKPQPTHLYGYGSYGLCCEPEFSIAALPYVDRGMVYAIAHIRGGGEMGRAWFEIGAKYLTKINTFTDFISCAEELISRGVTTPSQLACEGRSAGGLLMGAVLNMRPDLFSCAVAGVPFVDVLVSMCDPSIPLTAGEWLEWGNPNQWKFFHYMKSYSPIDNVISQPYPHIFIHAGLHDSRVAYWEPAKWASKLRLLKTDANDVLVKMEMDAGHFSASDRYAYWRERAQQQAFVIKHTTKKLE